MCCVLYRPLPPLFHLLQLSLAIIDIKSTYTQYAHQVSLVYSAPFLFPFPFSFCPFCFPGPTQLTDAPRSFQRLRKRNSAQRPIRRPGAHNQAVHRGHGRLPVRAPVPISRRHADVYILPPPHRRHRHTNASSRFDDMTVAEYGLDAGDTLRLVLELPVMRCGAVE